MRTEVSNLAPAGAVCLVYSVCVITTVCSMGVRTPEVTNPPKLVKCPVYFVKIMLAVKTLSDNS